MSGPETPKANKQPSPSTEKKQDKQPIAELKNGKVIFRQKPVSFEKQSETLQDIVKFRSMLEDKINAKESFSVFPEEFKPLIAKLAHESDKTLNALAKYVHQELLPAAHDAVAPATSAVLPVHLIECAIQEIMTRNNYGIDVPLGVKPPAAICVWRWEVKPDHISWLPKNSIGKAELRQAERIQAKEELKAIFETYSQKERDAIIDPKGAGKVQAKDSSISTVDGKLDVTKITPQSSKKQGKKREEEPESETPTTKQPRPKKEKVQDPEKIAKEKEKLEKKAAKAEKEKKEKDAHSKSQSIMAKFFVKPKSPSRVTKSQYESAVAGPSRIQSDFEKVFKPFVLQKDKVMAPANWFLDEKRRKRKAALPTGQEVIVIDSDEDMKDEEQGSSSTETNLEGASNQEHLNSILASLPPGATPTRVLHRRFDALKAGFRVYNPVTVRDLMAELSEAEVSGNDDLVRSLLAKLNDRELLPAKAFCFHTDARPGYFGTWTRSSRIIGPRTPFAKDTLVFDYAYDSGEEWEEEPVGEDVVDDGDEEDVDGDEQDSDLDSWLVDDDEDPNLALLHDSSPPPILDFPTSAPSKRKADEGERKIGKRRKVVVPLVPFAKGPVLETVIGQCDYEPFRPYAIQLFNDTPLSIDPFTFVSTCIEDYRSRNAINNAVPTESAFAIPALPPRLTSITNTSIGNSGTDLSTNTPTIAPLVAKKVQPTTKFTFPEVYMPLLMAKFTQIQASSITALVESIYLDLKEHKVKKTAIEAKVREVGEKCKEKKVWIIKPALLVNHSLQIWHLTGCSFTSNQQQQTES
ncbi:Chromatin assembly factor 1 subunit A [Psilocybe cubensis]|uniref:Chromatin assembly factor 1 subunit A n=2 Tax=Psilocybe cubensis TaxID=181762 RepID=A0ACB8H8Q5_PSICU|nr:Chromatin assembly factor 1 subunit A [Psilocybe cubensis]KAH9484042.1 Chromatin assembly factor 1 subunit A [Psilocybe cubensis]